VTLVPKPSRRKLKAYCGDSDGGLRVSLDGTAPRIVDGLCDPALPMP
jgi:hypothetical protein